MAGTAGRSGGNRAIGMDITAEDGQPEPPCGRSDEFTQHWEFVIGSLPAHALRRIDTVQLTILCDQLVEIDQLSELIEHDPSDLKARSLRLRICQQVARLSAQFGMSPADRKRIAIEPAVDEDDPFDELSRR